MPVDICKSPLEACIHLHSQGGGQIITLNPEMIIKAQKSKALFCAITKADLVLPDGIGVVWAMRLQGIKVPRTPGIELAQELLCYAEKDSWSVALIGAAPKIINRLTEKLAKERPSLQIVLTSHGMHDQSGWRKLEKNLKKANPDLVLVALDMAKQEVWSMKARQGSCALWIGVGGSFDIWSGKIQRAPNWIQKINLEWLFRLFKEPKRWKRIRALPTFLWKVGKELAT